MTDERESAPAGEPPFRLRFDAVLGRAAFAAWIALEVARFLQLRERIPFRPRIRRILWMVYYTPELAFKALAIGAAVAILTDLVFRLLVRPAMARWYAPRPRDPQWVPPHTFHAKAGERTLAEVGARLVDGRKRPPGSLVVTDCALTFYPYAWDREPWTLPIGHMSRARLRTPRRRVLGLVEGYPDNVAVTDDSGEETAFVVADPEGLLALLRPEARAATRSRTA